MTDWLATILLGIIEGITEFLPISSTGHLLLAGHWLGTRSDLFYVVIQSAAVLAVIPLFHHRLGTFLTLSQQPEARPYLVKVLVAFGITGAGGFLLELLDFKLREAVTPIATALVVGGILFLLVELRIRNTTPQDQVSWTVAVLVGLGQLVAAVFPGASRSGTTILVALVLGLSRPAATEFTFLVSIPTMLAAGGVKIARALWHPQLVQNPEPWDHLIVGMVVSAMVSFLAVKWLLHYVQRHTFVAFGWYRIVVGSVLLLFAK